VESAGGTPLFTQRYPTGRIKVEE